MSNDELEKLEMQALNTFRLCLALKVKHIMLNETCSKKKKKYLEDIYVKVIEII